MNYIEYIVPIKELLKLKNLVRSYFWLPLMDSEIENIIKNYESYLLNRPNPPKNFLNSYHWPQKPWTRLHIDYLGPIFGSNYFVLVDATSKWLEVFQVNHLTTQIVIRKQTDIFARFSLPKSLASDSAKYFKNEVFKEFLEWRNIVHFIGAPYHPETNGEAESAVKIIKNCMKRIKHSKPNCDQ